MIEIFPSHINIRNANCLAMVPIRPRAGTTESETSAHEYKLFTREYFCA